MELVVDLDPRTAAGDHDGARIAAHESNDAGSGRVMLFDRDGARSASLDLETSAVGSGEEMFVAPMGSGATADVFSPVEVGATLDVVGSVGVAPGTNGVASEGLGAGTKVGAAPEANFLSAKAAVNVAGRMCHQCRHRKTGVMVDCTGSKKGKCTSRYCKNCICNRYPSIADEVLKKGTWECPKCRDNCNCSVCQNGRGQAPTGRMVGVARKRKDNLVRTESNDVLKDEIVLPRGTLVTCIAGIELQSEDVGTAIQFLEFCRLFGEIFQIRKGQPEQIIKDIIGYYQNREVSSVVGEIHINLLSVIEDGKYKPLEYPIHGDAWIKKVGEYISDSTLQNENFNLACLSKGVSTYKSLSPSCKLDLLNFLCDGALSSEKFETWIEDRDFAARQKIHAATLKEDELKEKYNDMAKTMEGGETASNEEANNILSQMNETKKFKKATLNELQLGCILRTTPVMVDKGVKYWKLIGYCNNNTNIMRQEINDEHRTKNKDMWFMFTEDEQKLVEHHLTTRSRRLKRNRNRV